MASCVQTFKFFPSSEGNVWKYVFHFDSGAIAEAVLYKYDSFNRRTVICISVQSGCPVGCTFCGTGGKFIRNLTVDEIVSQVTTVFEHAGIENINDTCQKLQIMFMSMGEPFFNYGSLWKALRLLNGRYTNAQLLVSTVAPRCPAELRSFLSVSKRIPEIGLQLSVHSPYASVRNQLIPYQHKLSLRELRDYGVEWWHTTSRKPYVNVIYGKWNESDPWEEFMRLFPANVFCFTFSVLCTPDETMKEVVARDLDKLRAAERFFENHGYDTRVFNPAGQDDVGAGCGQLWYTQRHLKGDKHVAV